MKNKGLTLIMTALVLLYFWAGCGGREKETGETTVATAEKTEEKVTDNSLPPGSDQGPDESAKTGEEGERMEQMKQRLRDRGIDPESSQGKRIIEMMKSRGMGPGAGQDAPLVELQEVSPHNLKSYVTLNGKVEPERSVKVYSRLSAYVEKILKEEDDYVSEGTVMALLDDTEIRIQYRQAENQLKQAELTLNDEEQKFNRSEQLKKEDLISEEDYQMAKTNYYNARIEYQNQMENFKDLQLQLEYTQIRAPIEGYIVERLIDVGSRVNANEEVYSVEDFSPLLIRLYVPASDAINLEKGMPVDISSELFPGRVFQGEVKLINPRIDAESGTVKVTVEVKNSRDLLKPGMFVEARILISEDEDKLAIPHKALVYKKGAPFVFLFAAGQVRLQGIETGISHEDRIEVVSGLQRGDKIVVVGIEDLKDGMKVRVKR